MHILWWTVVGMIAGWATGQIMRGTGYGIGMDIMLGIAGSFMGGFLMRSMGYASGGAAVYSLGVAMGGAVVLASAARFFCKGVRADETVGELDSPAMVTV
jgi:uncharacterized membrane protein YeaQ/YmgE (transglycosylase-associated protein family)